MSFTLIIGASQSLSSTTSLRAWFAMATFPKIRVKMSYGFDSFYVESKQTPLFSWEDNSKVSLSLLNFSQLE